MEISDDCETRDPTKLKNKLKKINKLIELSFLSEYNRQLFKTIELNCSQLKTIEWYLQNELDVAFNHLCSTFNSLKQLKRLTFNYVI